MPKLLSGELPLSQTAIGFVETFEDLQDMMRWLGESHGREILAFDTESTGLDPHAKDARVRLAQIGTENEAWVIDAERWPGICIEILERYRDTPFAFHNVAFDAKYMQVLWPKLKFPWAHTHDTMLMHRIHDNEAAAGLKPVSEKLFGREATMGQRSLEISMANGKWTWGTIPMEVPAYRTYSGVDVLLTARLYRRMHHVHSGEFREVYDLEREVRRICTNMELRGMRIDTDYCRSKKAELDEYVEKTIAYCKEKYGVEIGSTKQLGTWFESHGFSLPDRTATGLPKMGEDQLKSLIIQGSELADYALKARKATKISGTYLQNFLEFGKTDGGIVHHTINTMAARTGRMSITDPALQTLPRRDTTVRPSIIPHPGEILLSADSDQIEFRFISALAEDEGLIARFRQADSEGPDVFTQIGREVFEDPEMVKGDPRRDTIKTLIYARLYGAGLAKQALSAGVTYERMKTVSDAFDIAYPAISVFQNALNSQLETMKRSGERPYVTTFTGRRLYVDPDRTYAGLNYWVQGACAEVLKQSLVNLDYSGLGDMMLTPVHDEVVFSVDPEAYDVEEVRRTIDECMSNFDFAIPLPASCGAPMERWKKQ